MTYIKIKKNFIIIFIIMFLFSFCVPVFAGNEGSFINVNYDYLYNYNLIDYDEFQNCNVDLFKNNYDTFKQKIIEVSQSSEVRSGDWTYFGGFYKSPFILLVKSDLIIDTEPYFYICDWKELGVQHFRLVFPDLYYKGSHPEEESTRFKMYYGDTYFEAIDGNMACTFVGSYSSTDETFSIPYSSNFDNNVLIKFHNNSTKILRYSQPYIANTIEQLQNLNASMCAVLYDVPSSVSYLSLHKVDSNEELFNIKLSDFSDYVQRIDESDPFSNLGYVIPWDKTGFNYSIEKNQDYELRLTYTINNQLYNTSKFYNSLVNFTTNGGSNTPDTPTTPDYKEDFDKLGTQIEDSNKETQNTIKEQTTAINNQTEEIKKQHETSKNIFQKIGEMLSYINPFSENFFVYKLLELLFEGLKNFILPSTDFMSQFFNDLSGWFQERLGFLWTPFDIINEFLDRLNNDELFSEPIVHIPNIQEPFTGQLLISAHDFNFNSLLTNDTLKTVHSVYLVIVDFVIYIGVMTLCYNSLVGVFRGSPDSITINSNEVPMTESSSNGIKHTVWVNKKNGRVSR